MLINSHLIIRSHVLFKIEPRPPPSQTLEGASGACRDVRHAIRADSCFATQMADVSPSSPPLPLASY